MSPLLVDTNVLLDVAFDDPHWADRSTQQLKAQAFHYRLIINDMTFAELSVGFTSIDAVDEFLEIAVIAREAMPKQALFAAGRAFARYRRQAGTKANVLPDFLIGAHAAAGEMPLLTRDIRRYRTYFPTVRLIAPPIN